MVLTRSRAAASKAVPLSGKKFTTTEGCHRFRIGSEIQSHGGKTIKNVVQGAYLLCTKEEFDNESQMVNDAKRMKCPIINLPEWIAEKDWNLDDTSSHYLWNPDFQDYGACEPDEQPKKTTDDYKPGSSSQLRVRQTASRSKSKVRFKDGQDPRLAVCGSTNSEVSISLMALILDVDKSSVNQLSRLNIEQSWKYLQSAGGDLERAAKNLMMYHSVMTVRQRDTGGTISHQDLVTEEKNWLREVSAIKGMTTLDHGSTEFKYLEGYFNACGGDADGLTYEVNGIYRVECQGARELFPALHYKQKAWLRRLLWYGAPTKEYGRILTKRFEVVPVQVPGLDNFGNGIQLFETSLQATKHCDHSEHSGEVILILCEAMLGYPFNKVTKAGYINANDPNINTTRCEGKRSFSKFIDGGKKDQNLKGVKVPDTFELTPNNPEALSDFPVYFFREPHQVKVRYVLHARELAKGSPRGS